MHNAAFRDLSSQYPCTHASFSREPLGFIMISSDALGPADRSPEAGVSDVLTGECLLT